MTATAVKSQAKATPSPAKSPSPSPSRRRGVTPLTPMRREAAKSMRKLAASVQESHPDMTVHDHIRDAAKTLESGNEDAAQQHLRAAMFALTPQSLMRNGIHTDDAHIAARQAMHRVHRHLLLTKNIADAGERNRAAIARDGSEDDTAPRPQQDPNNGYGPGALAQKPTARQPPGDQALNAPVKADGGGSDPAAADPDGPQPKGSKQFAYGWDDLCNFIALTGDANHIHIPGSPYEWEHGYVPISEAAARSHFGGKVPKGWSAPAGAKKAAPTAQRPEAPRVPENAGKAAEAKPQHQYAHPETAQHEAAVRQAVRTEDYDAAAGHLKQMDALEKKAGVAEGEGMRPAITKTAGQMKLLRQAKAAAYKQLPKEREQLAGKIAATAGQVITAQSPYIKTTPGQAEHVKASLGSAAEALRAGDHEGALRHLAEAQEAAKGPGGTSVLTGGADGRSAVQRAARHEKDVRSLADRTQSLARYAPQPKAPRSTGDGGASAAHAATAQKIAGNVRLEPGLTRGQKEEAEQRLYKAASHLDAGNHAEAASELDATMHATSLRGGGIIKGSTAAQARDLRDKVRAGNAPAGVLSGSHPADRLTVASDPKATARAMSYADLQRADVEMSYRATLLGKAGQMSRAHKAAVAEMQRRSVSMSVTWNDVLNVLEFSAKTAALEVTPALYGKPGGPGLYGVAGQKHSDYFEQLVKAFTGKRGMDKAGASRMAWGALRRWAAGGGHVTPEVRAAASKALAEEEGKAHAHAASRGDVRRSITLTGDGHGNHIPGTPFEYEHGYVPLTEAAAKSHFGGKVPKSWKAPSGGSKASAKAAPDLSDLPPEPKVPSRDSVNDYSLKSMGGYLDAQDRNDAWQHASSAGKLQKSGAGHQKVMQALAAAEMAAPKSDRAFHASRLDAYASAHGLKGFYRHTSQSGGGKHMVQVNKIRTPADGDHGRYYASDASMLGGGAKHVVDRDTGKIVARVPSADAAKDYIGKAESGNSAGRVQQHAATWDDVDRDIRLSNVIELFNPAQPRVAAGTATAGQFAPAGTQPAAQPAAAKQTPAQKAAAAAAAKASAEHKAHVAHVAHVNGVSSKKAELQVTAQDDRQKAAGLIKQRNVLEQELQSAAGKVSSGQAGSTTSANATTSSSAPATTASTAPASTTAASTTSSTAPASTTASAPAAPAASAGSAAAIKAQIGQLNTQINQLLAQAKQAETQAATMK